MSSISIKGIVLGALFGVGAALVLAFLALLFFPLDASQEGSEPSPMYSVARYAGNVTVVLVGGYFAARIAKRGELINGALSSFLYVGGGIYLLIDPQFADEWMQNFILNLAAPPIGLLGGYIYRQTSRAQRQPHSA